MPQGEICSEDLKEKKTLRFTIMYELTCDEDATKAIIVNGDEFNPSSCFNAIKIKTRYVCPKYMKKFISWYERFFLHKYVIAFITLTNGIFLMFFGRLHLKLSMCFSICLLSYLILGSLNYLDGQINVKNLSKLLSP